jgi:hypothetical protein
MRTDDLIRALSHDHAERFPSVAQALALALGLGLAVSFAIFMAMLGFRADIAAALHQPRFVFKFVVTLALAASATALVLRLAHPGAHSRPLTFALWLGPALLGFGVAYELAAIPQTEWGVRLVGKNARVCVASIPLMAAPLLAAALIALRRGAPTRPKLAGAVAGLAAGGLGAALYAAHCTDDSPLFVMAWYVPAIALVTAAGVLLGPRILRW